jgi:fructokinase
MASPWRGSAEKDHSVPGCSDRLPDLARKDGVRVKRHLADDPHLSTKFHEVRFHSGGLWSERAGEPVKVADTVGAGDSFAAALALGMLAGWPLDEVHRRAGEVAAYVCTQPGGTPELPQHLCAPSWPTDPKALIESLQRTLNRGE